MDLIPVARIDLNSGQKDIEVFDEGGVLHRHSKALIDSEFVLLDSIDEIEKILIYGHTEEVHLNGYNTKEIILTSAIDLIQLWAEDNQIKNLDLSNTLNLRYLDLSNNPITVIPSLPSPLTHLYLSKCPIKNLFISSLRNLEVLDVSYTLLSKLPELPNSLFRLKIRGTQITDLENIPASLNIIEISANFNELRLAKKNKAHEKRFASYCKGKIKSIDMNLIPVARIDLPSDQKGVEVVSEGPIIHKRSRVLLENSSYPYLHLDEIYEIEKVLIYPITEIAYLPAFRIKELIIEPESKLTELWASGNELRDINLDNTHNLKVLDLALNYITYINDLPNTLTELHLSENPINKLPQLPDSLTVLNIRDTQIVDLENIPPHLNQLQISSNFNQIRLAKKIKKELDKKGMGDNLKVTIT